MSVNSRRFVFVALCVLGCGAVIELYRAVHFERWKFERNVIVGLTQEEILKRVGQPDQKLQIGDTLSKWGNALAGPVDKESWIYFVVPKSQHRFIVTFDEGKVATVNYQQN